MALVGDAGYCASPLSGLGTSLALVGAYILAGELGPADSFDAAAMREGFAGYQEKMRPYVDKCQDLPNSVDLYAPKSETDITITIGVMRWMQRRPLRWIASRLWFTAADSLTLPDYPTAVDPGTTADPGTAGGPGTAGEPG